MRLDRSPTRRFKTCALRLWRAYQLFALPTVSFVLISFPYSDFFDYIKQSFPLLTQIESLSRANTQDNDGRTLLHWASILGYLKLAQYLIMNMQSDVHLRDLDGNTPLHYAARQVWESMLVPNWVFRVTKGSLSYSSRTEPILRPGICSEKHRLTLPSNPTT
jgi:hypothetical protein